MDQIELKLLKFSTSSSLKLHVGFNWTGEGFEYVIVIVKLSMEIHYFAGFDYSLWTTWSSAYISIFFLSVFLEYDQYISNLRFCSLYWNIFIFFFF